MPSKWHKCGIYYLPERGSCMDLILVNPGDNRDIPCEHLGLASLSAYIRYHGYSVDMMDMALDDLDVPAGTKLLMAADPAVIGISMLDKTREKGLALVKHLRYAGFRGKIIAGGYFPTFHAEELLLHYPEIDHIVRGEGELTLLELMSHELDRKKIPLSSIQGISYRKNGTAVHNRARPLIRDLDLLPPPDRKYARAVLKKTGHLRVNASRGCWGNCSFCDINAFYSIGPGPKWRSHSIPVFVTELKRLRDEFNCSYFILNDDNFMTRGAHNRKRALVLAEELQQNDLKINFELMGRVDSMDRQVLQILKSAGLRRVFLGIESFDQAHLDRFNKGTTVSQNIRAIILLKQLQIDCIVSVILADAHTRLRDLLLHFYTLFRIRRRYFNSNRSRISINEQLEIYRGSALYRQYKQAGLLTRDNWATGYRYQLKMMTALRLNLARAEKFLWIKIKTGIDRLSQILKPVRITDTMQEI